MNILKWFRPTGSLLLGSALLLPFFLRASAQTLGSLPEEPRPAATAAVPASSAWLLGSPCPPRPRRKRLPLLSTHRAPSGNGPSTSIPAKRCPLSSPVDKILFSFHRDFVPSALIPVFTSAGFGQLTGGNPKYGVDSGAFGDRLGADALRQASMRFFVLGLFPALDHSDPRYLRKASGSLKSRIAWAAERAFVTQRDSGQIPGFNEADIFGHLAASALTMTYYPAPSVNGHVVL